jgi:hypothetical protein
VVSHISRKTSEIWGTRSFVARKQFGDAESVSRLRFGGAGRG